MEYLIHFKVFKLISTCLLFFAIYSPGHSQWDWQLKGDTIFTDDSGNVVRLSMAFSGDGSTVIAGNIEADSPGSNSGVVEVYEYSPGISEWIQKGQFIYGETSSERAGASSAVNIDGNIIAYGATGDGNFDDAGYARVLKYNNTTQLWEQMGQQLDGLFDDGQLGHAMSLNESGDIIAVSATGDEFDEEIAGYVLIFKYNELLGLWEQLGQTLEEAVAGDKFGRSVALDASGHQLVVSSKIHPNGDVRVYSYDELEDVWVLKGQLLVGLEELDEFGVSVDMSNDGNSIVVGADGAGVWLSDEGLNAGHTYVYNFDEISNEWVQKGNIIYGNESNERSGNSVSMNANGNSIAIGTANDGTLAFNAGEARVFKYDEDSDVWIKYGNSMFGGISSGRFGGIVGIDDDGEHIASMATRSKFVQIYSPCVSSSSTIEVTSCSNYISPSGAIEVDEVGFHVFEDVIDNSCGLDSIITIELEILDIDEISIESTVEHVSCFGLANGTIDLELIGGTSPYELTWSTGMTDIESLVNLAVGTYSVDVMDANGCVSGSEFNITQPDSLVVNSDVTLIDCYGNQNGIISLEAEGGTAPYMFDWGGGFSSASLIDTLSAGTYEITIEDANGCQDFVSEIITEPDSLSLTIAVTHVECYGESNGSAMVMLNGGVEPYDYEWNGEITTELNYQNLPAGDYDFELSDSNSCELNAIVSIEQPQFVSGDINCNEMIDEGEISGDLDLNGSIDGDEIAGDINGDGVINSDEVEGDSNGDGLINNGEIGGDTNGDGFINGDEVSVQDLRMPDVGINVYPNPSNGEFTLQHYGKYQTLSIFNPYGGSEYDLVLSQQLQKIDIELSPGIYFLIAKNRITSTSLKLIIE